MAILTQDQIALAMIYQLRVFDPNVSAEVGTPERKLLDTFAEALAEAQVNINVLGGALDIASKYGSDLDNFIALFGFGRQQGASATGFINFGRPTASSYDITIPNKTQVSANITLAAPPTNVPAISTIVFQTTAAVTLVAGQLSVTAPIQALLPGSSGNVAANTITQFANLGSPPLGITTVTNPLPTSNGADAETDPELKARFKNTVFRNLAGTEDQYLALAVSTQFSTKANVLGPISRYQEYMQVPTVDDSQSTVDGLGNGVSGQWTTTPSNNPYSKYVYSDGLSFLSNGSQNALTIFYRKDTDFILNAPPLNAGETYREFNDPDGVSDVADPATTPNNPNITLLNVYTGVDPTLPLPRPSDVVLLEYSYLSSESRNDIARNITNCVDVYINGENPTAASAIIPPPSGTINLFNANRADKFYFRNFRRIGQPDVTPVVGHGFTALYWQPLTELPSQIVAGNYTYLLGTHYWAVEDKTLIGNTVRSRNGIEWNLSANGVGLGDPVGGPYTGQPITTPGTTAITVAGYTYDKNIVDLQAALDSNKQITSDVLAHRSAVRYFKFDFTLVYSAGAGVSSTNSSVQSAIANFFDGQYFGSVIQLSDLLVAVRGVPGVQNVRWTNDVQNPDDDFTNAFFRVNECDSSGNPRGAVITATATHNSPTLTGVTVVSGTPAIGQAIATSSGLDSGTTISNIVGPTYTLSHNYTDVSGTFVFAIQPQFLFNADFYLKDNELPALPTAALTPDTLPGLILRPRAQGTFNLV